MGNCLCCGRKREKKKIVLLLVGLDNAGKSVAVQGLAGESLDFVVPTVGLSVVYLKHKNYMVKVFDLGGGANIRGIWQKYFVDAHGVIFVVDSSDFMRLDEARATLFNVLSHDKIAGKPVLLLANKQDVQEALDEVDIVEKLDLELLVNDRQCPTLVVTCAATDLSSKSKVDAGIVKGFQWLVNYIIRDYDALNARVEHDVKVQQEEERKERAEKLEKLRQVDDVRDDDLIESFSDYDRKLNEASTNDALDDKDIFYIRTGDASSVTSSRSADSFPNTYYGNLKADERPKSATYLVQKHIEHHNDARFFRFTNKTAPMHVYGVRYLHSAGQAHKNSLDRRRLKSAGDTNRTNDELFHLNNFQQKLPPLTRVRPMNALDSVIGDGDK